MGRSCYSGLNSDDTLRLEAHRHLFQFAGAGTTGRPPAGHYHHQQQPPNNDHGGSMMPTHLPPPPPPSHLHRPYHHSRQGQQLQEDLQQQQPHINPLSLIEGQWSATVDPSSSSSHLRVNVLFLPTTAEVTTAQ
jgi:hypothetical protein